MVEAIGLIQINFIQGEKIMKIKSLIIKQNETIRRNKTLIKDLELYLMVIPGLLLLIVFKYIPLYGIIMAFNDYNPGVGILSSKWVGLLHFIQFFNDPYCYRILKNTVVLGVLTLAFTFPAPIIFALMLNEVKNTVFKKITQTISYMPYFLSIVIVVGMMADFTSYSEGIVNSIIQSLGGDRINFFGSPEWFRPLYIISAIWQGIGFSSIIYLAAIAGINIEMYEAAIIDGAGRLKQIFYVTLPSIMPTITILFILAIGGIMGNDFQKIFLMYNPSTYSTADVVSTYVYRAGILGASYSYSTAIGLFLSIISFLFLYSANKISKKVSDIYLW